MEASLHLEKRSGLHRRHPHTHLEKIFDINLHQDCHLAYLGPNNHCRWTSFAASDTSISSCGSIEAYPLVEDKDPPEIGDTIPEVKMPNKKWLTLTSIMVVNTIFAVKSCTLLKVLFDLGSTATLINRKCLPKHCKVTPIKQ